MASYILNFSKLLLEQVSVFSTDEQRLVLQKLELAKLNPFRYKTLTVPGLTKVFEIKITLGGIYRRVVYTVQGNEIRVECIIDRNNDFRDLVKLLYEARKE